MLELMFQLRSTKEMSSALNITIRTVNFHKQNIFRKLGISEKDRSGKLVQVLKKLGDFEISVRWVPKKLEIADEKPAAIGRGQSHGFVQ